MRSLEDKIKFSLKIISRATGKYVAEKMVIAWTGGKDSTVLLHLIRAHYKNKLPIPVMFNDSTMEFKEIYDFIEKLTKMWKLKLTIIKHHSEELSRFYRIKNSSTQKRLSRVMKINAINRFFSRYDASAIFVGIRWDEHPARSKEKYFSPRKDHVRIHPLLHFSENDIWAYIKKYKVPYVSLYDQGYRSLGEAPFTNKSIPHLGERSGREYDKEKLMDKLRNMGYW